MAAAPALLVDVLSQVPTPVPVPAPLPPDGVFQGGLVELVNIPQAIDNLFAPGDIAELQLRMRLHVPGLETSVRLLLEPALGEDLLLVSMPQDVLRIRWRRNLGPIAVIGIVLSLVIVVSLLLFFVLFKISPETAQKLIEGIGGAVGAAAAPVVKALLPLLLVAVLIFTFTQQRRRR